MSKKEVQVDKEEIAWFKKIKKKLFKYINDDRWDMITLPNLTYSIIEHINNTENVWELSPCINERIVNNIFEIIEEKFKKVNKYVIKNDETEFKI